MTIFPKKNVLAAALASVLLLSLTACGGGGDDAVQETSAQGLAVGDGNDAASGIDGLASERAQALAAGTSVGTLALASSDATGKVRPGLISPCAVSADGALAVFNSSASALVAGDTNNSNDVFVKNVRSGAITRVSTTSSGAQITSGATCLGMSSDGTSVVLQALTSSSSGGTIYQPGNESALFVKNLQSGTLTRVSPPIASLPTTADYAFRSISADGKRVAFVGNPTSTYLGAYSYRADGPGRTLIREVGTGALTELTQRIQVDVGTLPPFVTSTMMLSPDGNKLAFDSRADHPAAGDTNGKSDVFVLDLPSGVLSRASSTSGGAQGVFDGAPAFSPQYSVVQFLANGTQLAFFSPAASNLGAAGTYVKRLAGGRLDFVLARETDMIFSSTDATALSFSDDGSKVALGRRAGQFDTAFVRTLATGVEQRVAVTAVGVVGNNSSRLPLMSSDGSSVLFQSNATNLSSAARTGTYELYVKTIGAAASSR